MRIVALNQKKSCKSGKICPKKSYFLRGNFSPIVSKSFIIPDHFFPLLFRISNVYVYIISTALSCYPQQVGYLLCHHWFIFILHKWFLTISIDLYDLVIFEEKGHICKVIAAILISTKPPLISCINHYCLWSLAPASAMVELRLQRVAK